MFRNLYDGDVTTLSPQGRLFQVEYAMEAVKQGAAAVGVSSASHVVIVALKRTADPLATHQRKLITIDDHIGVGIAGLTSDARILSRYMQRVAMASRMDMDRPIPVQRLVTDIADKAQETTLGYGNRPYGVGLLIAGYDETGTHLFEFSPAGTVYEYTAMAIGARSQAARTYLEKHAVGPNGESAFSALSLDELVIHALSALRDTLPPDAPPLTAKSTALGIVGVDMPFMVVEDEDKVQNWLDRLPSLPQRMQAEPL